MKIATFVSRLFEPMAVLTILVALGAFRSGLSGVALYQFFIFLLLGMTLPVALFRYWIVKTGRVKDWDIHNRKERLKPLGTLVGFTLFFVLVVSKIANPFMVTLFEVLFLWIVGFFILSFKIKASGHVGIITLAVLFVMKWYGVFFVPMLMLPFFVAWARLIRKDHTLPEVLVGAAWSLLVSLVYLVLA
jgi:hypothetical protein